MAKQKKIPLRPNSKFIMLSEAEKDCLTWYVLSTVTKSEAYAMFVRPDLRGKATTLRVAANEFFASPSAMAYTKAYEGLLDCLEVTDLTKAQEKKASEAALTPEEVQDKKLKAVKALINWATEQSINIDELKEETAALVLKVADKVGLFSEVEKPQEEARRYLPESCETCRLRVCFTAMQKSGEVFDECEYCRYRKQSDVTYSDTEKLDITPEKLKELGLENYTVLDDAENDETKD
jgi:hypothetical protein